MISAPKRTSDAPVAAPPIRVFVAEDHAVTSWGLQRLIDGAHPVMQHVGTAARLDELLAHEALGRTDVLVLDLDLAGVDASAAMPELMRRCPGHILVLTGTDDPEDQRAAIMKGARGILHKAEPAHTVLSAIEKVHAGEVWVNRQLLGEVLGRLTGGAPPAPAPARDPAGERVKSLTRRERDIVSTLAHMAGDKLLAVADAVGMSEHTLRNHLTTIYSKLCVHGRLELHLFATRNGLDADPPATDARR